ncbi:hypothetical protein CKAH01_05701 [Colletotrichum kahawae]|uniref:Uncharacterized protein n=1 Tax=Colletotrichum kahawae TaxID=34407 RepID=A0AAD9YE23_COLKA|nr:hypothetical protein CKAH01_05701 [Colletotrichum kahawae]
MLRLLSLALAISHVQARVVTRLDSSQDTATPLFTKEVEGNLTTYKPYDVFDYNHWTPESTLYDGLPMLEKQVTVDGKQLTYQDFNVSALTTEQFKTHYMNLPEYFDAKGNFIPTDAEVKTFQYVDSLIAHADDPDAAIDIPTSHVSKRAFPDMCFYDDRLRCSSSCTNLISRGVRQSFNNNVYGYYHYVSDAQCGTGSVTKTVSVTHVSGVTIGGTGQIPGFGKGWTKAASTFFSTFGLSIGHTPDSVTTGISYSGTCGAFNVCFLWERPHFSVDKGVVVTQHIDVNSKRACTNPTVTPYEVHVMHESGDAGGSSTLTYFLVVLVSKDQSTNLFITDSHGMCYSMGNHGCGSKTLASDQLQRCPNNY